MKKLELEFKAYLKSEVLRGGERGASASSILIKYNEDQQRDENGRFAGGGSEKDQKAADKLVANDAKIGNASIREQLKDILGSGHQSGMSPGDEITPRQYGHYVSVAMRTGNHDLVNERYKNTDNVYEEAKRHAKESKY